MAHAQQASLDPADTRRLGRHAWPAYRLAFVLGAGGLVLALLLSAFLAHGVQRFAFAYLTALAFVLSVSLGGLFFVLITHLFRAGWSVVVRRPAEVLAANMPTVAALFAPILALVLVSNGALYPWAQPLEQLQAQAHRGGGHGDDPGEHDAHGGPGQTPAHDPADPHAAADPAPALSIVNVAAPPADAHGKAGHAAPGIDPEVLAIAVEAKRPYLNTPFWTARLLVYLGLWSALGLWFWRTSTRQDQSGDPAATRRMEVLAAPGTLVFALTLTFGAIDLFMSLDPIWYSTMFGVYYFAGAATAIMATLILTIMGLQNLGYFRCVTPEHFHDLGKLLFAFVFFWGYIAYSQFMLIWYASLPETTYWFAYHGATTVSEHVSGWSGVIVLLLLAHLLIPFAGLLSRHVKRKRAALGFWAVWLLVVHYIDLYWLIRPVLGARGVGYGFADVLLAVLTLAGVLGVFLAGAVKLAAAHSLVPARDPRLAESMGHQNI